MKLKITVEQAKPLARQLLALVDALKILGTKKLYWDLREALANLPPNNVYHWPKVLDDAWHKARGACRVFEANELLGPDGQIVEIPL